VAAQRFDEAFLGCFDEVLLAASDLGRPDAGCAVALTAQVFHRQTVGNPGLDNHEL
jgi:hypothetical protein